MTKLEETGSGKSKMVAFKLEIHLSQLGHKIGTTIQLPIPMFWGPAIHWNYSVILPYHQTVRNRKYKIQYGGLSTSDT